MNRNLLIWGCVLFCSICCHAKDSDKEVQEFCRKMIERYDVPESVRNIKGEENSQKYWKSLVSENLRLEKLNKALQKNKGAEKEALDNVKKMTVFHPQTDPFVLHDLDSIADCMRDEIGLSSETCSVHIYSDSIPAASTGLTVDGKFAVFLNGGLMELFEEDTDLLMAAIANQVAHGLLRHHLSTEYKLAKKKRKDKLTSGLLAGVGTAVGLAGMGLLGVGYLPYGSYAALAGNDAPVEVTKRDLLDGYRYMGGDVIEADLAAYRYLDQIEGEGYLYIDYLKELYFYRQSIGATEDDIKLASTLGLESYVPLGTRILLLEYAAEHPEIHNASK